MLCLDAILHGPVSCDELMEFFQKGEFPEEQYLVAAIKRHLRSEQDRKVMYALDLSIEEILNGRYHEVDTPHVQCILRRWNDVLKFPYFEIDELGL